MGSDMQTEKDTRSLRFYMSCPGPELVDADTKIFFKTLMVDNCDKIPEEIKPIYDFLIAVRGISVVTRTDLNNGKYTAMESLLFRDKEWLIRFKFSNTVVEGMIKFNTTKPGDEEAVFLNAWAQFKVASETEFVVNINRENLKTLNDFQSLFQNIETYRT